MTGPQHYREAEALLAQVTDRGQMPAEVVAATCQAAQVHATLALAAAVAFSADMTAGEWPGWRDVAASAETRADAAS